MSMTFPDVFLKEDFKYDETDKDIKPLAVADGLSGWACCMAGTPPPEHFGIGMVKIGEILDVIPTDENLSKLAGKILRERKKRVV